MSTPPFIPHRVPTLTEVLDLPQLPPQKLDRLPVLQEEICLSEPVADHPDQRASQGELESHSEPQRLPVGLEPHIDTAEVTERVLQDIQRQCDRLLEFRLREAMEPLLQNLTQQLVQEARASLALTLKDVVAKAVAQALARQRQP